MNGTEITDLKKILASPKKVVIIPHKNPDGDAIGSTLGLYHYLKEYKHDVCVITPNDYPEFLKWMPGENAIIKFDTQTDRAKQCIANAELIFTLDFNSFSRVDDMGPFLEKSNATFVMIDHHQQPDNYAKFMYSDTSMSSTCEMVYHFINFFDDNNKITADIANCLYAGIMTDTGSFRFPSTTSTTHRVIADLIDKGAKNANIHQEVFDTQSLSRLHLLGCALKNLVMLKEYHTVYITLTKEELQSFNYKKGDTEGFVNYGLSLKGIKFAAIFIENQSDDYIKISFRSKGDFSVNEFARAHYNGGGHNNAAGGRSDDNMEDTTTKFVTILDQYKALLQS